MYSYVILPNLSMGSGEEHGGLFCSQRSNLTILDDFSQNTFLSVTHGTSEPAKILEM